MGSVLSFGDAVSNQIIEIERRLTAWGFSTSIYGSTLGPEMDKVAKLDTAYHQHMDNPEDLLIYHYSAYCENHLLYQHSRNRKLLIYHNITPGSYYAPYDLWYQSLCSRGRQILPELRDCDLALGDSEYNRLELVQAGFADERTGVLPIFLRIADFGTTTRNESLCRRLRRHGTRNILFVGRVAPNKAFEDLINVFFAFHRYLSPNSRLLVVGTRFLPRYDAMLDALVERLGLTESVTFADRVSQSELKTYYEAADLFLCASRHEGFCVPLLESMYFDVPVLARAVTGIPYTLGSAGIAFHKMDYAILAETMHLLIEDQDLRRQVLATQRQRLDDFATAKVQDRLREALQSLGLSVPVDSSPAGGE
jgi:glycosyltransferase involved in cell wall biosynthesis